MPIRLRGKTIIDNVVAGSSTIGAAEIAASAVTTAKIADANVTRAKLTAAASRKTLQAGPVTVATTGTTSVYVIAPEAGSISAAKFIGGVALAASDTNYITFTLLNLGSAGTATTAVLAGTATDTTKTTGGVLVNAGSARALTLHATAANLVVAAGDPIRCDAVATGTLANTVTTSQFLVQFAGTT